MIFWINEGVKWNSVYLLFIDFRAPLAPGESATSKANIVRFVTCETNLRLLLETESEELNSEH